MAIEFTESAGKHGFTQDDAVHAITYAMLAKTRFDTSRTPGGISPDLYVGPAKGGLTIEVMAYRRPPRDLVIFHVMQARAKTLALIEKETR